MPLRFTYILFSTAICLISCSYVSGQEYFSVKKEKIVMLKNSSQWVRLRPGEIFRSSGRFGYWQNDTFELEQKLRVAITKPQKREFDEKDKKLKADSVKFIQSSGIDSVKINLKKLNLGKQIAYIIAEDTSSFFLQLLPGRTEFVLGAELLPKKFRLSTDKWPVLFFERDRIIPANPNSGLISPPIGNTIDTPEGAHRLDQPTLENKQPTTVFWPPNEFVVIVLMLFFLLGLILGWKVLAKLIKPANPLEDIVKNLREQIPAQQARFDEFVQRSIAEKTDFINRIELLTQQLSILEAKAPFYLPPYKDLLIKEGSVANQLSKAELIAKAYLDKIATSLPDSMECKAAKAIFEKFQVNQGAFQKEQQRWERALLNMDEGNGLIIQPEILSTIKNVGNQDTQLNEIRQMLFIQWLQHKISATLILMEEISVLPMLIDQPSTEATQLAGLMRIKIDDLKISIKENLSCNLNYISLYSPVKDRVGDIKAIRVEKPKSWYLNTLLLDSNADESIIEIERYATNSKYLTNEEDKLTQVLIKTRML